MTFRDHFAAAAAGYRAHRPGYPSALFDWVAGLAPGRALAWDAGTGSGQAAVQLAARFARVVATDASAAQLAHAEPHERVEYRVAPAEASGLPGATVDLVTAAQALHWFDAAAFFAEVGRALRPRGAVAVWTYGDPALDDPVLHAALRRYNEETVGPYWSPERDLVRRGYAGLAFPFERVEAPPLSMGCRWTLDELAGYVRSWSATLRYTAERRGDPVAALCAELAAGWGDPSARRAVRWPLTVIAGRLADR